MRSLALWWICGISLAGSVFGQEVTGSILGSVEDPSGALVPGAIVTITNTDRNSTLRTLSTSASGNFTAPLLPIGTYSVSVEANGFKRAVRSGITLNVNDKLTIDFSLELGDAREEVVVAGGPAAIDLQSATSQNLISGSQVRELALNNRNYEQLVALMPGVVFYGDDQIYVGVSNPSGQSNQVRFSINGSRPSQNAWTIDGADNVDRGANLTLLSYPSVDAIAEFRVLRGQYNAEFGRDAGAMINVITRSGTNQFHGDAYEFFRNDVLAANTFFNNLGRIERPPLRYNNFGYTLGGPVFIPKKYNTGHDRTFFFFSQEFRRVITYASTIGTAPTAEEKQGLFTNPVCVSVSSSGTCQETATQITNINLVAAQYLKDIFNRIPDGNANHQLFLSLRNVFNFRQELYKIDHKFSDRWMISGRFIKDKIPTEEPRGLFTGAALPGVSNTSTDSPGRGVVARMTTTISPTMVNEAGYSWSWGAIISSPTGLILAANSPSIKPTLPFPVSLGRVPTLSFGGALSAVTGYGPYDQRNVNHNWFDNLTKIAGKHSLKTGVSIIHYTKRENQATNNASSFTFATTPRPNGTSTLQQAWANFLLGNVATFTQTARDITPDLRVNQFELYLQDEYRIRRNLTLTFGARYSNFRQPTDAAGYLNNFDPSRYDPANAPRIDNAGNLVPGTGDPLNGLIVQGGNSPYGSKITNENNLNLAPRFGFSWDPMGQGRMAIRGGYGIAYDFSQVGVYESPITGNPSSVETISIVNTRLDSPASSGSVSVSAAPPALSGLPLPYQTPYVQQWSLDVQKELPGHWIVQAGYYGSKGTHLFGQVDINQVYPGLAVAAGLQDPNAPITRGASSNRLNLIRPYRGYNAINAIQTWFNSSYNGLQTALERRFGDSFFNIAYTWSKAITDAGTDLAAPMNTYNRRGDRALAPFDRRHVLTLNWNYELPWFRKRTDWAGYALGGWQLSGIATFNSGLPLTISSSTLGTDPAGLGFLGPSASGARPDQTCDPNQNAPRTIAEWFNKSCFEDVPAGQIRTGNAGRSTIRGPGLQRWDISAYKNFRFAERYRLQFRAEGFNVLNHTNFASVSTSLGATNYGNVTAARDPRILQLALKLYW